MNNQIDIRQTNSKINIVTRDGEQGPKQIQGYAIVFNQLSVDLGGFVEIIKPEAINSVDLSDVALVYAHKNNDILARASAGNLQTSIDDKGVYFVATLPDTTLANDVYNNIVCGNISTMSFAFSVASGGDSWTRQTDGTLLHTVTQFDEVPELTVTGYGAYQQTSVEVRDAIKKMKGRDVLDNKEETQDVKPTDKNVETQTTPAVVVDDGSTDETVDNSDLQAQIEVLQTLLTTYINNGGGAEDDLDDEQNSSDDTENTDSTDESTDSTDNKSESDESGDDNEDKRDDISVPDPDIERDTTKEDKKEDDKMPQVVNNQTETAEQKEVRSYIEALKFNKRDGVTVNNEGAILVPKQILDVQATPQDPSSLASHVNRVQVSAPTGTLPVIAKASARLVTKEELAKNPEVAKASITPVQFAVKTYIGQLPISLEMLQDYADAESLVSTYLQNVKTQTEEATIASVLSTKFGANVAKSLDDVKAAFNRLVNYGADRVIVMSVSAFNAIDQLKDGEGRYVLQPSAAVASGSTLFGAEIVIVADENFGKAGDANIFVGSLKHAVVEAVRQDIATSWVQNDFFEQVLSVGLRMDVEAADLTAGAFYSWKPATSGAQG